MLHGGAFACATGSFQPASGTVEGSLTVLIPGLLVSLQTPGDACQRQANLACAGGPSMVLPELSPAHRHFLIFEGQWARQGDCGRQQGSRLWLADHLLSFKVHLNPRDTGLATSASLCLFLVLGTTRAPERTLGSPRAALGTCWWGFCVPGGPPRGHTEAVAVLLLQFELSRVRFAADAGEAEPSGTSVFVSRWLW